MTDTLNRSILTREERTELRQAQYRRRRLIGWMVLASVLILTAGGAYVAWGTSVLGLKNVALSSTSGELDPALYAEIQAAVGVADGTPLISIDLLAVRNRVAAIPGVASAQTSRTWPATLDVEVTPRVAVAVVAANSSLYLLDSLGDPYLVVSGKPAALVSLRLATPGPTDPATLAGVAVVAALPAPLAGLLTSVTARSPYDITLELTDGRSVVWGGATDNARKAQVLPAVLAQPGKTFDVSDPEMVTVR